MKNALFQKLLAATLCAVVATNAAAATATQYHMKVAVPGLKPAAAAEVVPSVIPNTILVSIATYYNPNNPVYDGNLTSKLKPVCDGKTSCTFNPYTVLGYDPYVNVYKALSVTYSCAGVSKTYTFSQYHYDAGSTNHTLSCP